MGDGGYSPDLVPRLCHIVRWPDFNGYGFNLHAEKGKAGQFIGKVDDGSPAEAAGLKAGDRIVEVNGTNIGNENHQQVVGRIKAGGEETRLLVVDPETDLHYKEQKKVVRGDLPEVKFLTAARDEDDQREEPQVIEDSTLVPEATNGTEQELEPEPVPEPEPQTVIVDDSSRYVPRLCNLCKWPDFDGYGFNLHAEKEKPGQYIGLVDAGSPAEVGGLRDGDRIIEVNGDNIETFTHTVVIQKIKSGGEKTSMLVVDKETDEYFKSRGQTVCSSMTNVLVITTPPRLAVEEDTTTTTITTMEHQHNLQVAAFDVDVAPAEEETPAPEEVELSTQVSASYQAVDTTPDETTGAEEQVDFAYEVVPPPVWAVEAETDLPEPNVDLSDTEAEATEVTETVTAVVSEEVESAPVVDVSETVHNGTEEKVEVEGEVEVAAGLAAVAVTEETVVVTSPPTQEDEDEGRVVGGVEYQPYEEVDIVSSPTPEPPTVLSQEEDSGTASNGINGGTVVETRQETVIKTSEPQPAVLNSTPTSAGGDDLNLNLSAAEMKERLKSRKKQDPRQNKTSFEYKYKMFEKM